MYIVGVDIKSYGVFYVVLKSTAQTPMFVDQGSFPLSLEAQENQRKVEISNSLKKIIEQYPPSSHSYVFSTPQNQISVHKLNFPFTERFKIKRSLPFEIEENIPFSLNSTLYSPKFAYSQNGTSHVLTYVTSKSWVEEFLQFIETSVSPSIVVPKSVALSNVFENIDEAPPHWKTDKIQADQIKIHLSYETSIALVLCQNKVIMDYNLNWNLQSCIEEISSKYRRNLDQAFEYFCQNAFITHEEGTHLVPLLQTIKKSVSELKHQIQLLFLHLKGMEIDSIKEIHLLGPGSQIQNLTTHLFEICKIPVHVNEYHPSYPAVQEPNLIALGTALCGFQKPKNPCVNLIDQLKNASGEWFQISEKRKKVLSFLSAIFIGSVAYSGVRSYQSEQLLNQVSETFSHYSRKVAGLRTRNISIENIEKFVRQKQRTSRKNKLYSSVPTNMSSALEFIKTLSLSSQSVDEWNLEIQELEVYGNKISLKGSILKNSLEEFKDQLKALSDSGRIIESSSAKTKSDKGKPQMDSSQKLSEDSPENKSDESTQKLSQNSKLAQDLNEDSLENEIDKSTELAQDLNGDSSENESESQTDSSQTSELAQDLNEDSPESDLNSKSSPQESSSEEELTSFSFNFSIKGFK